MVRPIKLKRKFRSCRFYKMAKQTTKQKGAKNTIFVSFFLIMKNGSVHYIRSYCDVHEVAYFSLKKFNNLYRLASSWGLRFQCLLYDIGYPEDIFVSETEMFVCSLMMRTFFSCEIYICARSNDFVELRKHRTYMTKFCQFHKFVN